MYSGDSVPARNRQPLSPSLSDSSRYMKPTRSPSTVIRSDAKHDPRPVAIGRISSALSRNFFDATEPTRRIDRAGAQGLHQGQTTRMRIEDSREPVRRIDATAHSRDAGVMRCSRAMYSVASILLLAGCNSSDGGPSTQGLRPDGSTGGGGGATGGEANGSGGAGSGGKPGSGGANASGGRTSAGGTASSGGAVTSGGTSGSGGATGSGGTVGAGGSGTIPTLQDVPAGYPDGHATVPAAAPADDDT